MPSSPGSDAEAAAQQVAPEQGEQPAASQDQSDAFNAELGALEDRYRRALADLDNFRKRAAREIERRVSESRQAALLDWLDVVDSIERALQMEDGGPCAAGLQAVLEQTDSVLARQGAARIGGTGEQFDPHRHEAVAVQPSDSVPDRTILAVVRSGFALGDRVVRPAQVVVAAKPEHAH
jgi:molecular chaperone GrpE